MPPLQAALLPTALAAAIFRVALPAIGAIAPEYGKHGCLIRSQRLAIKRNVIVPKQHEY